MDQAISESLVSVIRQMQSDIVRNYVIAGLDSSLLNKGKVRLFECGRNHQDSITPHSHRFDFACLVLRGSVVNRIWKEPSFEDEDGGDFFEESTLTYEGEIGEHKKRRKGRNYYSYSERRYEAGETYSMQAEQIHSISFSKGALVLFFEGPQSCTTSMIIEPVVDGVVIPTYEKRDYMFLANTQ